MKKHVKAPLTQEELGMRWWDRLTERERADWLRRADSAVPADAWVTFQKTSCALE